MSDETIVPRQRFEREAKQALCDNGSGAANPYPETSLYHAAWAIAFDAAMKAGELEGVSA